MARRRDAAHAKSAPAMPEHGASGVPLRRRLVLLAAVGILPLALMAGIGLYALEQQQRGQAERVGLELARALATAVDAELRSTISVLEALATTVALDRGDLPAFRERAVRVLGTQPNWAALTLADPSGALLVDSRYAPSVSLPPVVERPSFNAVASTSTPSVGNLLRRADGIFLFAVRVPVIRNREVVYVLTALVRPEEIRAVITRHGVPDDWVISIFDGNGRRVARSRAHEENLGGEASPTVRALMDGTSRQGFGLTYSLEGDRIYTPYSRIYPNGWSAAIGIPANLVEAAGYRTLAVYGGSVLLSIVLGTLAAMSVARSISRPMAGLRAAAQALGRRQPSQPPDTVIQEIRDVSAALVAAADERTRSEAHREELLGREREARAAAESADRAKDQFLAVLSHELRTPLNAVYGWARMLRTGQIRREDQLARAVEAIERNANMQIQLVDDLLDVSRVISGKMRLDVRTVDLRAVVEAALDAVRPAAEAKGIQVRSVLDAAGAGPIAGDPDRLQQVVWNLLINAVKFTSQGGRIQVQLQPVDSHVEIVVSDTGRGIAPEILPFVFERFRQADSSSTRAHSGLGLGLALVKHVLELHGGTVEANSDGEGRGATFVVRLPLATAEISPPPAPRAQPSVPPAELPSGARLDELRIVVVDDDADALELAAAILTAAGAVVRKCPSASEAFGVLCQWRPDVLISDLGMPGEDGFALIRKVRALDPGDGGETPAVALTAYGRTYDRTLSLAAGYNMHVPKPIDPGEFTAIVARMAVPTRASGARA